MEFYTKKVSKFTDESNFLPIINACVNASLLIIFLCVYNFVSKHLKEWYTAFQLSAFIFDVSTLLLILIAAKYLYHSIFSEFDILYFVFTAMFLQFVYSFLYYVLINNYWIENKIFLFHKNYIDDVGIFYYFAFNIFIITVATLLSIYYCLISSNLNIINLIASMYFYAFMVNEI
uniref:Uncharacterized protein n=1 Tax=viral metagenome TaxID=1070528 RepID=A0A6C0HQV8_9ZZZZ